MLPHPAPYQHVWLLHYCNILCPPASGVFAWVAGPLKAGTRCMLAYNCRSGPLAFTNTAKMHLGYDGWYNKEKQVSLQGHGGCCCLHTCGRRGPAVTRATPTPPPPHRLAPRPVCPCRLHHLARTLSCCRSHPVPLVPSDEPRRLQQRHSSWQICWCPLPCLLPADVRHAAA